VNRAASASRVLRVLYTECESKYRAVEALAHNRLVQSEPEITRLARERGQWREEQPALFV
jgi:hypothetical protein